jgi:hypothetical protein
MIRLPKNIAAETSKANYSPKANRIFRKPNSVKRPSHRHNLSDGPKIIPPFPSKRFKPALKIGQSRETTKVPISALVSPKARVASTSRPKTFGIVELSDINFLQTQNEISRKQKYSDSGIPTEQLLQSYSCRSSGQHEELQELWKEIKLPTTAATILKLFPSQLSLYEQSEILSYDDIYYIGLASKKVKNNHNMPNHGYDDERGDYKVVTGDHIACRFQVLKILGQGSFGQVLRVYDHKDQQKQALKIIRNKSRFHQQAMVEIEVLKFLKEKDFKNMHSVVHINDNFIFRKHVVSFI